MIPWVRLDAVQLDDGPELRLMQRGSEFSIMLGSNELMNSRQSGSEEALARLAAERLEGRPKARMLIGGLGMGFTLRAALASLGRSARVTVAELVPEVIAWARGPMAEVFVGCLDDPRVSLVEDDVGKLIGEGAGLWDAILLDVDNGPEGLTRTGNDALYSATGLAAGFRALTPGGVFSVWSSVPDPAFTRRLRQAGFDVDEVPVRASTRKRGARHMIWVAVRPG
ncbi:MAG: spermidine synthase [Hoeflea sp.]|uniref:spermidine synthase n=1 Tax=Hoeflea sp. TaxID=1940281 RepID=UPI001DF3A873|nr:spermidine synthase [Hoeflea sp.]MBU4530218.1 spermidine synthase [Alphaproteobacteria bacterium]MBU4542497.1 spermidine synthase [Alphaproteobacteria bacterium]MBU4551178.1 spermidine synthase [Alphaproteobacteria bacterium]MBV1723001.1 spermidine synthase [Hoeflea sp.]MBV1760012.1 spermidine synthase [Hoeflea sp.]